MEQGTLKDKKDVRYVRFSYHGMALIAHVVVTNSDQSPDPGAGGK